MKKIFVAAILTSLMPIAWASSFCCSDAAGRRVCGDPLPTLCYDRAYREVSKSGRTIRQIDAPLTPQQRAARELQDREREALEARQAETRRRDAVLLETYPTVNDIDKRMQREIASIQSDIQQAEERQAEIISERSTLEKKKPAKGAPSRELADELVENTAELKSIRSVIESKKRDIEAVRVRFEADRKRYMELMRVM